MRGGNRSTEVVTRLHLNWLGRPNLGPVGVRVNFRAPILAAIPTEVPD